MPQFQQQARDLDQQAQQLSDKALPAVDQATQVWPMYEVHVPHLQQQPALSCCCCCCPVPHLQSQAVSYCPALVSAGSICLTDTAVGWCRKFRKGQTRRQSRLCLRLTRLQTPSTRYAASPDFHVCLFAHANPRTILVTSCRGDLHSCARVKNLMCRP